MQRGLRHRDRQETRNRSWRSLNGTPAEALSNLSGLMILMRKRPLMLRRMYVRHAYLAHAKLPLLPLVDEQMHKCGFFGAA